MNKIKWLIFIFIGLVSASGLVNAAAPALLGAGDTISIWVKGEPELSVERQVGRDGSIIMPLIGSVGVSGMKTTDAARLIVQMLEDGYLKDPLVQVTLKGKGSAKVATQTGVAPVSPSGSDNAVPTPAADRQVLVEIVDAGSRAGIADVAMMLGNKIYQSNRLGQILLDESSGYVVVIADGFSTAAGQLEEMLKTGNPPRIYLKPIKLADSVTITVVDAFTRQPLPNVEVLLEDAKVATNRQGSFKISLIKKEFGEITLKRKGYRQHRQVVDFKGPAEQTVMMVRDE